MIYPYTFKSFRVGKRLPAVADSLYMLQCQLI
nr:MAG TPA: hypothetical protein [Caudoviricetes sp.]